MGKALDKGLWSLRVINIRDYGLGRHQVVDDTPYGGGAGMVMRADVIDAAFSAIYDHPEAAPLLLYPSPRGPRFSQKTVTDMTEAGITHLGLLCGRYEGVDQRVLEAWGVREISIGDYVLSNGDLAAQVILDALLRHRPGILGSQHSVDDESFAQDLLEYPHYTRPEVYRDKTVPEVLRSGHHGKITAWRRAQACALTQAVRPDLWKKYSSGRGP